MERNNTSDYILMALSVTFLVLGKFVFPVFVFISLAPLFLLFYNRQSEFFANTSLFIRIFLVLIVAFLLWNFNYENPSLLHWLLPSMYAIAIALTFVIYAFTNKYAKNRIGIFTLIIYWLAMDFLLLQIHPLFSRYFLATAFDNYPEVISWNVHTGFMGVTFWVLMVNVLLFSALFKDDRLFKGEIQWVLLVATLVIAFVPFFINIDTSAILQQDILTEAAAVEKQQSGSGEFIGRTAVWVSALLILYSFVKREVTK